MTTPQPIAASEPSERDKFEAWWGPYKLYQSDGITAFDVWHAWQARAALTPAPAQPALIAQVGKTICDVATCERSLCMQTGRCHFDHYNPKPAPLADAGAEPVAKKLAGALREAMHQAVAYDGLDLSLIGPKHWYSEAKVLLDATAAHAAPPTLSDAQCDAIWKSTYSLARSKSFYTPDDVRALIRAAAGGG